MSQVLNNEVDILNVANIDNDIRDSYTRAMIAGEEKETYCTRQGGYDINEFFIWTDRQIYKTKAVISQGDTFVLNTNIELAGTLSDQMYQLFSQSPESMRAVLSNIENGSTASRNFVKGEYILWTDGFLYVVTANTNIGTAWAVGTNITKKNNITDEITSLNSDLSNEIIARSTNGAHNLLNIRASQIITSGTLTGTINDDESLTLDGTPIAAFALPNLSSGPYNGKVYNLKPNTKYVITYGIAQTNSLKLQAFSKATSSDAWSKFAESIGNNYLEFTTPSSFYDVWIRILLDVNTAVSALKIYPMIRLESDKDETHQPYAKTNRELTEDGTVIMSEAFNMTLGGLTQTNRVYRIGNICFMNFAFGDGTFFSDATGFDTIGIIPNGFRPTRYDVSVPIDIRDQGAWASANHYIAVLRIGSQGAIALTGKQSLIRTCPYMVGQASWICEQ